jgi:hypothetical protein
VVFTAKDNFHWPVKNPSSGKKLRSQTGVVAEERIFGSPAAGGAAKLAAEAVRSGNKR